MEIGRLRQLLCLARVHLSLPPVSCISLVGSIGDVFGEMALMLDQPRSATVVCTSEGAGRGEGLCVLNEIKGGDFMRMLRQSDGFLKSMKVIMRTRLFRWVDLVGCHATRSLSPSSHPMRTRSYTQESTHLN